MLSKAQISLITSLQHKKFRTQHNLFVVEGIKSVLEFAHSTYKISKIFATADAAVKLGKIPQNIKLEELTVVEFGKISSLKNPQGALALVEIPHFNQLNVKDLQGKHSLILDDVQDPGNLGTIIRTAEWFGIENIICSIGTVDAYNPKVVQATMGSLSRIKLHYLDLEEFIQQNSMPIFGALLKGDSIYETNFGKEGFIMMGNEGNGIRETLIPKVDQAVTIPRVGKAESLNVAVATTIFCSELTRQNMERKNG
ncbi:TrmH family RNA methyltransferase [Sphingobacterium sp. BS-2]|uniref:TrmH family RNA methyltransferase n=1 Tax=Sphingobacterium sp. BS-2 TaxID=3377129 RepID=UPI0038FCACE7